MAREFPLFTRLTARDSASPVLGGFSQNVQAIGRKLEGIGKKWSVAITAPVTALGFGVGRTAFQFESEMNRVAALTGATGRTFAALTDRAREMGVGTAFSASEAAAGMAFLAQAGFTAEEAMAGIPAALSLASAGGLELADAADIASNVMTGFGLAVEDFGRIADVMAFTAANANTNVQQLGDAFKFAGPTAVSAGLKLEEVAGIIGALSDAGIQGEMAGTALRGAIGKLVAPSGEAVKVLRRLGFAQSDLVDSEGRVTDFLGILEKLAAQGATTGDVLQVFGQRAGTGIAALLTQIRSDGIERLRADIAEVQLEAAGSAAEQAETRMRGLPGALKRMRSAFSELALAIDESGFGKFLQGVANTARDFAQWAANLPKPVLALATAFTATAAAIGPLLIGLGAFVKIAPLVGAGVAVATGPIGLAVFAVGSLVVAGIALYKNWERVARFLNRIWDRIRATFSAGIDYILDKLKLVIDPLEVLSPFLDMIGFNAFGPELFRKSFNESAPKRLKQSRGSSGGAPRPQNGRARVEIEVRSDRPGVRARAVEASDVDIDLEQGVALGGL